MTEGDTPALVPVRMVNEFVYCPRLFYLEWVQNEWADNAFTEDGRFVHRRANKETKAPPLPDELGEKPFKARSVAASSDRLGLTTRIDIVEGEDGVVMPVEYKRGRAPDVPNRVHDPERVQVCAQALVLRDAGYKVARGEVYFAESKERIPVELDAELIQLTEDAIRGLREVAAAATPPSPLVDSPKCNGCSLVGICLPDEVNLLHAGSVEDDQDGTNAPALRRLHPARDDAVPVYVQRGGARVGISGDVLEIRYKQEKVGEARLEHTSQVSVFGNVQVSTQAVRALLEREIPLAFYTSGGWFYGWARGFGSRNVELRRAQYRVADDPERSLVLARRFVSTKVWNQRTLLRRNCKSTDEVQSALQRLTGLRDQAERATSVAALLGIEGTAARLYFGLFPHMLKCDLGDFSLEGRNRRPPRDPLNALLSFVYALLTKDWTIACGVAGLDPFLGFYHRTRFGRPSLALDLMEEFRPLVGDSVVLSVVNGGVVTPTDFVRRGLGVALTDAARRRVISTYERRMDELITHPTFGYRISYRRTFEVQARLLGRYLTGEIEAYPPFRTR